MSSTALKSTVRLVGSLWGKYEEEGVDRCKPNFNAMWERHGAVKAKEIVSLYLPPFEHNTGMRQTDR